MHNSTCHCGNVYNVAITGNPNVGKSVIFNYFTNMYTDVSNYPGTTIDVICGRCGAYVFSDVPGIYGLSGFTEEERLARDIILRSDIAVNVVDASHLERDLFLTQHLIDAGIPIIVVLNMMDEAKEQGIYIKIDELEKELGVPVVPAVAVNKNGLDLLLKKLPEAKTGNITPKLQEKVDLNTPSRPEALLIAEGDEDIAGRNSCRPGNYRDELYRLRRKRVNEIVDKVVREITVEASLSAKIGRLMLKPATGIPLLLITLLAIYQLIGVFVAQTVVGYIEEVIMGQYYQPLVRHILSGVVTEDSALWSVLVGQFGLLTMAVTYLFGLLLPLIFGFQLVLSILEDSGYLPRIATLLDRLLIGMGLNGQAVIPLILGFGCVTMATISTRMLGSDREKLIAIFLLAFAVPCSAQMAIITSMIAGLGFFYVLAYGLILFTVMVGAGTLLAKVIPGSSTDLWIDLPPVRLPRLANVLKKTWIKSAEFIKEAAPLFAAGALFLSLLKITGGLTFIENLLVPITVHWLGLPKEAAGGFILGFIRREFGTAGLFTTPMDPVQQFVALITITFFVPCIATAMIIFKERGWKQGAAIWLVIFVLAFIIGGLVAKFIQVINTMPGVSVMPVLAGLALIVLSVVLWVNWKSEGILKT
uniref:ferrous iron transport protein B n=1 Tax=Desulforadius tongensis TaxID=1216062 RepID=UPI003083F80D